MRKPMMMMSAKCRSRGFTVVEVVVVTSVLAIIAALSVPMYESAVASNRTRAAAYTLMSALTYARGEAIKTNTTVSVSPVGTGWQDGWTVTSGGNTLSQDEPAPNLSLGGPVAGVTYLPNGRLNVPGIVLFTISAPSTGYTRCVTIDPGGRPAHGRGERYDGSCV